jgi:putative hemolysin
MLLFEVVLIFGLILLNAYFALSEIALLSVKKSRLKYLSQKGNEKAQKALALVRQSPEMLSTIQVAITTIGIFAGAFGGATISEYLENYFSKISFLAVYGEPLSVILVVIIITYFSLVIGELVPKQIALSNSEKLSLRVAGTITILMKISRPLVKLLSFSTKRLLRLLSIKMAPENVISEEEIKLLMAEGIESGAFEKSELKMVENIFYLGNRPIKDFITPNEEITWVDINDSISKIKNKIKTSDATIFPVKNGNLNNPVGAVETNDILNHLLTYRDRDVYLKNLIQPIMYIEANLPSLVAIDRLKKSSIKIAFVFDNVNSKILGILSFHDILEAIVGDFQIKHQ